MGEVLLGAISRPAKYMPREDWEAVENYKVRLGARDEGA
jgi:hypothetical protein